MGKGVVQMYFGEGRGKSTAAIGNAIHAAGVGKNVIIIEFLKGKQEEEAEYLKRLEPEIKLFRFAKLDQSFESLSEEQKKEEIMNLRNGFNYGKKVISTGACDLVILDEILGVLDENVITVEEMAELFSGRSEDVSVICTGRVLHNDIRKYADQIYKIAQEK